MIDYSVPLVHGVLPGIVQRALDNNEKVLNLAGAQSVHF